MADGTITIPKIGEVKKSYVYGTVGTVGGYIAYRWWRAGQDAAAAAADVPPESTGTIGADIGSGTGGYYDPNGQDGIGSQTQVGTPLATDDQWYEKAMQVLSDAGIDTGKGAIALGKYLDNQGLTDDEQKWVRVALAGAGNPPSGARTLRSSNPPAPSALTAPQHLRSGGTPTTGAIPMVWDPVSGAAHYMVFRGYTQIATVNGTAYTATGLQPGTSYTHTVRAANTGGSMSPPSAGYTAKTAVPQGPVMSGGTAVQVKPKMSGGTAVQTR